MSIIQTEQLSFSYDSAENDGGAEREKTLDTVSLNIEKGSFVSIVGVNGSGKSTLAKCLNALLLPTEGRVLVREMDTAEEKYIWDIRSTVGMVFQNPDNQIVSTIVEEDVAFGPENLGIPPEEIRQRIDKALRAVGLYELRTRSSYNLSGGQKQREAIAGVLAMEPECIIFDESTSMLDPQGRKDVMAIIMDLHERGITTILITHFMEEVVHSDRILVMEKGRVIADGTPQQIFSSEETVQAAGLEMPPAIRIRNELRQKGLMLSDSIVDMELLAEALLSIRESRTGILPGEEPLQKERTGTSGDDEQGGFRYEN